MPDAVVGAKVALFDCELTVPSLGQGVNMQFNDPTLASQYLEEKKSELATIAQQIIDSGANVVLSMKDIDPAVADVFAKQSVCGTQSSGIRPRAVAGYQCYHRKQRSRHRTADLGEYDSVEEKKFDLSPRPLLFFNGVPNSEVSSIMVFAPTEHLAYEIGRALDDAVGVVHIAHKTTPLFLEEEAHTCQCHYKSRTLRPP